MGIGNQRRLGTAGVYEKQNSLDSVCDKSDLS